MVHPIVFAVIAAAVVITSAAGVFYYAYREEEKCYKNGPSGGSSSRSSNDMPFEEYEPRPSQGRRRSSPNTRGSEATCRVCDKIANAKFIPCGHYVFCYKDAKYFLDLPQNEHEMRNFTLKCPICRRVINRIA